MSGVVPDRHDIVRHTHEQAVLDALATHAPLSRAGLADLLGLSRPTVSTILAELEATGLVRGDGRASGRVGRAAQLFALDAGAGHVLGVELGGMKVRAALADLDGRVLAEEVEPTDGRGGKAVVTQIERLGHQLAVDAGLSWDDVVATAVGTPGVTTVGGTLLLVSNIKGFDGFPLGSLLGEALGTAVSIDNDVNMAALGEQWQGAARDCRNFAVLAVGTGIGLGLVVDGRLVRGSSGGAGEVAYLPIGADPATRAARRRGALEVAASASGVAAMLRDELAAGRASVLRRTDTVEAVFRAAAAGDVVARRLVDREADLLARAIVAVAALVDPDVVILAGGIGANPLLTAPVRRAVRRMVPFDVRVETSALGQRSGVLGALATAVQTARREVFSGPNRSVP